MSSATITLTPTTNTHNKDTIIRQPFASSANSHIREMFAIAKTTAEFSKDNRTKVGAVACFEKRIIGTGRNGFPAGFDDWVMYEKFSRQEKNSVTVHAEANLIAYCARHGVPTKGANIFITYPPCNECCKLIITAGFKSVYYLADWENMNPNSEWLYRYQLGLAMLKNSGISVFEVNPNYEVFSIAWYDNEFALFDSARKLQDYLSPPKS